MKELTLIFLLSSFFVLTFSIYNENTNVKTLYKNNIFILVFFLLFALISSFLSFGFKIILAYLFTIFFFNIIVNFEKIKKKYLYIIFIILINFSLFVLLAVNIELGWDGQAYWYPKAYHFYSLKDIYSLKEVRATHPHFGAYIWGFFWKNYLIESEYSGRLFLIFLYINCLSLIIFQKLNLNYKNLLSFLIIFLLTFDLDLFKGYQEYYLFCFFSIYSYIHFNVKCEKTFFLISLLLLNLLLWVKNESILLSFPILILTVFYQNSKFLNFKIIFIFFSILIYFLKYFLFSKLFGNNFNSTFILFQTELFNFSTIVNDLILFFYYLILSIFKYPIWILIILFLIFKKKNDKKYFFTKHFLLFSFSILILLFIYHLVDTSLLKWSLSGSLDRLMFSLSGYFVYYVHKNIKIFL